MKLLFIPTKTQSKVNKSKILEISKQLPQNLFIAYSIQFQDIAHEIEAILSQTNKITSISQVLGCSNPKVPGETQAILLIGSGRFHAISLAYETKLPIYIMGNKGLEQVSDKEVQSLEQRNKAAYLKFLNSDNVGILVSTKPGQENIKIAFDFKKKLKNKKSYLFLSNNIDIKEFENFRLDSWVNTSCPRLDMDSSIINIRNISLKP